MLSLDEAVAAVDARRALGQRIMLATGVFDLLDTRQLRHLIAARSRGDALIVAVYSDRAVRDILGPARPIMPEAERAEILRALAVVDAVVVFDDDTPQAVIDWLRPDVVAPDIR